MPWRCCLRMRKQQRKAGGEIAVGTSGGVERETMKKLLALGVLLYGLLVFPAIADSWLPAKVETYISANGNWRLTVYPRQLTSPLDYFRDKVDDKSNAGGVPGDTQRSAMGHMERRQHGRWQTVWKMPLANEVSPVEALVSNDGEVTTFDNWHNMGWGDDAVVIYSVEGEQLGKFGLGGFLPKGYIDSLPHSVSSIHWRGEPRIDEASRQLVIPVVVPTAKAQDGGEEEMAGVDIRFRLSDGSLVPPAGKAWDLALASAAQADARRKQLEEEAKERFISPLSAPRDGDVGAWHRYLVEAFFRIDSDWMEGFPAIKVVPLSSDPDFALLSRYLGEALVDDMNADDTIMVAALSQDVLVQSLEKYASEVRPGSLAKARIYVAADNAHIPAASAALKHTGAEVIQIDIDKPIPQRKERLEAYLRNQGGAD